MKWQKERDLLIAQTMAFVQSVSGKPADTAHRGEPAPSNEATKVATPREVLAPARLSPLKHGDLREEIQRRVAAFRTRQQLFERDRDEYCNATLARARAVTEQAAKASVRQPIKR
jgi:hypothetical protein